MLSIINAAESQFRHESEMRMREHALLASIRERRAAQSSRVAVAAEWSTATSSANPLRHSTRAAWPRPIGVKNDATSVCPA